MKSAFKKMDRFAKAANKIMIEAEKHKWFLCQGFLAHCATRNLIADKLRSEYQRGRREGAKIIVDTKS